MPSKSSTTESATSLPGRINVGLVVRPHGIRGEVLVEAWSERPERFASGSVLGAVAPDGSARTLEVVEAHAHRGGLRVRFSGFADRDAAEALRGYRLDIDRAEVPEPPPGAFYVFELVGCRCHDRCLGDLGEVVDLTEQGGGSLIEVRREDGRLLLLPFVEDFLVGVDRAARTIEWRLPEGLVEACASRS